MQQHNVHFMNILQRESNGIYNIFKTCHVVLIQYNVAFHTLISHFVVTRKRKIWLELGYICEKYQAT